MLPLSLNIRNPINANYKSKLAILFYTLKINISIYNYTVEMTLSGHFIDDIEFINDYGLGN